MGSTSFVQSADVPYQEVNVLVMIVGVVLVPLSSTAVAPRHLAVAVGIEPERAEGSVVTPCATLTHLAGPVCTRRQTVKLDGAVRTVLEDQSTAVAYPVGVVDGETGKNGNIPTMVPAFEINAPSLAGKA